MFASDYRKKARDALRGKWKQMALLTLLAGLLGATGGVSVDASGLNVGFSGAQLAEILRTLGTLSAVLGAYQLFLGSWVRVGLYAMYDRMLDGDAPRAGMLFPKGIFWKCIGLNLLRTLYVFVGTLLFIVPGVVAAYSYAMADYLLSRNPEMGVTEALQESKRRMLGRRWQLFCLELSFFGWTLLSMIPTSVITAAVTRIFMGAGMSAAGIVLWYALICLIVLAATVFVEVYSFMADVIFFRDAEQVRQRAYSWQAETAAQDMGAGEAKTPEPPTAEETVDVPAARDMFFKYGCSHKRMREVGVLEEYEELRGDASTEQLWLLQRGNALILRFSREPEALDEILDLAAEYALDELLTRALERIDRHIRQQSLPDTQILNMAGRVLALVMSGIFDEHPDFVQRRKAQVSDMTDRLEVRLREQEPGGDWQKTLALVRSMCT